MQKIMLAVRARPGLTRAEAQRHLWERHAGLVAASPTLRRRMLTYVQNHAIDVRGVPDLTLAHDWIIEGWRDPSVTLPEPPTAPDAILVREDEARFPGRASLLMLQVAEQTVWQLDAAAPLAGAPVKLFTYFDKAPSFDSDTADADRLEAARNLAALPVFRACAASSAYNRALPGQAGPASATASPRAAPIPPCEGVDVWRFRDAASMTRLFADAGFQDALRLYERACGGKRLFRLAAIERLVFDDAGIDPGKGAAPPRLRAG